jgi:hypothetical protein
MLSNADSLKDDSILEWCEYFLRGLKNEIEKIDSLLDISYVKKIYYFQLSNMLYLESILQNKSQKY